MGRSPMGIEPLTLVLASCDPFFPPNSGVLFQPGAADWLAVHGGPQVGGAGPTHRQPRECQVVVRPVPGETEYQGRSVTW